MCTGLHVQLFLPLDDQNLYVSAKVSGVIKLQDNSSLKNAVFCENRRKDGQRRTVDMTGLIAALRHSFGKVQELQNQLYGLSDWCSLCWADSFAYRTYNLISGIRNTSRLLKHTHNFTGDSSSFRRFHTVYVIFNPYHANVENIVSF